jgi:hypothetical protein
MIIEYFKNKSQESFCFLQDGYKAFLLQRFAQSIAVEKNVLKHGIKD